MKNLILILISIIIITIQPSFASKYATLLLENNSQGIENDSKVIFQEFDSNDGSIINAGNGFFCKQRNGIEIYKLKNNKLYWSKLYRSNDDILHKIFLDICKIDENGNLVINLVQFKPNDLMNRKQLHYANIVNKEIVINSEGKLLKNATKWKHQFSSIVPIFEYSYKNETFIILADPQSFTGDIYGFNYYLLKYNKIDSENRIKTIKYLFFDENKNMPSVKKTKNNGIEINTGKNKILIRNNKIYFDNFFKHIWHVLRSLFTTFPKDSLDEVPVGDIKYNTGYLQSVRNYIKRGSDYYIATSNNIYTPDGDFIKIANNKVEWIKEINKNFIGDMFEDIEYKNGIYNIKLKSWKDKYYINTIKVKEDGTLVTPIEYININFNKYIDPSGIFSFKHNEQSYYLNKREKSLYLFKNKKLYLIDNQAGIYYNETNISIKNISNKEFKISPNDWSYRIIDNNYYKIFPKQEQNMNETSYVPERNSDFKLSNDIEFWIVEKDLIMRKDSRFYSLGSNFPCPLPPDFKILNGHITYKNIYNDDYVTRIDIKTTQGTINLLFDVDVEVNNSYREVLIGRGKILIPEIKQKLNLTETKYSKESFNGKFWETSPINDKLRNYTYFQVIN